LLNNALSCGVRAEGGFLSSSSSSSVSSSALEASLAVSFSFGSSELRGIWRAKGSQGLPPPSSCMDQPSLSALEASPHTHSRRWLRLCRSSHSLWILKLSLECFRSSQESTIKVGQHLHTIHPLLAVRNTVIMSLLNVVISRISVSRIGLGEALAVEKQTGNWKCKKKIYIYMFVIIDNFSAF